MLVKVIGSLVFAAPAVAHMGFYDPSMFGFNEEPPTTVYPLSNDPNVKGPGGSFNAWWFRGHKDKPPADGAFFDLPAGGTAKGQIACNKDYTSFGKNPGGVSCDDEGSYHTQGPDNIKPSAIAIAYNSDQNSVQPDDFVVISTNRGGGLTPGQGVGVEYQIPADLPACPEGGCLCSWGWMHGSEAGGNEMYFNAFRCKVSGATNTQPMPKGRPPTFCDNGNCAPGAKQPIYAFVEAANVPEGGPMPVYDQAMGYMDGAQTDLFGGNGGGGGGGAPAPAGSGAPPPPGAPTGEGAPPPSGTPPAEGAPPPPGAPPAEGAPPPQGQGAPPPPEGGQNGDNGQNNGGQWRRWSSRPRSVSYGREVN